MDLYTLTSNFLANEPIDEYVSAIWTERYWSAGDCQIVAPATPENIAKLAEGTYLAKRGSKEVMILETKSIKKQLLTVVGRSLPVFLENRYVWAKNALSSAADSRIIDYVETEKPGQFLANVVTKFAIAPVTLGGAWAEADLDWEKDAIPGLTLGAIDVSGVSERQTAPTGPLYDAIANFASQKQIGFSLYLDFADPDSGFSLKFKTYTGKDRTSDQEVYPLVRLAPDLESLNDVEEVHSIRDYRNVVYVYYQGIITEHLADPTQPEPEGFARRVLLKDAEGQPVGRTVTYDSFQRFGTKVTTTIVGAPEIAAFREQVAKDALANHNYIRAVDGQTSPINEYTFGVDYEMGDIIELKGVTGTIAKARITEYIHSQDKTGEKEYPTIAVL